jgi:hypothetical protein
MDKKIELVATYTVRVERTLTSNVTDDQEIRLDWNFIKESG